MSENNKIAVETEDLIKVWKILENLRVSLDKIGSVGSFQGKDKMHIAMDEYFTPLVYREIADAWYVLSEKYLPRDKCVEIAKSVKYFELKKYD